MRDSCHKAHPLPRPYGGMKQPREGGRNMSNVCKFLFFLPLLLLFSITVVAGPQPESSSVQTTGPGENREPGDYFQEKIRVDYSTAFTVEYHDTFKVVTVLNPWPGATGGFTYVLVQRGTAPPSGIMADRIIEVPIRSIVTMSTSYLPCLEELGVVDILVGHETLAWVYSEKVRELIAVDSIREVGSGQNVNIELLLDIDPDLIMTYGMGNEWDAHPKFEEAGLPYVINAEWNEKTPLGRAEWIKYIALFVNKEAEANAYFSKIADEYTALTKKANMITDKPSVFAGTPYQGTWWMSGGSSFAAQLFADAGAAYVWEDDESTGSLMLDIETVFERAGNADIWVNTGYWNTFEQAQSDDERFREFKAFKTGMMFNNNLRMSPTGGNDYYESAPIRPHLVLADLIKIFHPELATDHQFYYYKKLD